MKRRIFLILLCLLMTVGCSKRESEEKSPVSDNTEQEMNTEIQEETKMKMMINDTLVTVSWEDNEAVSDLKKLTSEQNLVIQMSMYGGFEQVGSLGTSLSRNDSQTTTSAGDIVLYSGNQIVVFYGSNSWAYTRLGRITDKSQSELRDLLGNGDVTITLKCE